MEKKTNAKRPLFITVVVLGVILAVLLAVLIGIRFLPKSQQPDATEPTAQQDLIVETPFCSLSFPVQWKDQLRTQYAESDDGGAMTFLAAMGESETQLFSVVFSSKIDTACSPFGVLTGGEAPVVVSLKIYDIETDVSWTDAQKETAFAMQDECNYLLEQLQKQTNFDTDYESYFVPEDIKIDTPFCALSVPGTWADRIWWEFTPSDQGGVLNVYGLVAAEDAPLFRICFGAEMDGAAPVGSIKVGGGQIQVGIVMAEPEDTADWTDADWDDYTAMQEVINDLLASLFENPNFTALS